jgi:splicing factor U2AF subunit
VGGPRVAARVSAQTNIPPKKTSRAPPPFPPPRARRVNCPFYHKIGACRHGDRCSRLHNKPLFSQSLALPHIYQNPLAQVLLASGGRLSRDQERQFQREFEDFYIDVFDEVSKFGEVEDMIVCDNLADHLVGNVYVKFSDEEGAQAALQALSGRFYAGRQITPEYTPVTEFDQARCRQYDERACNRGGYCNFMHMKGVPRELVQDLVLHQAHRGAGAAAAGARGGRDRERDRERDRDRDRDGRRRRSRSRSRSRERAAGREPERERERR